METHTREVITQAAELLVLVAAAGVRTGISLPGLWPTLIRVSGTDRRRGAVFYGPGGLNGGKSLLEVCFRAASISDNGVEFLTDGRTLVNDTEAR